MAFNYKDPGKIGNTKQEQETQLTTQAASTQNEVVSDKATQTADVNIKGLSETEIKNPDADHCNGQ